MSYSILYDAVFIKTLTGITPVVLVGDNNVYESSANNARRSRDWSLFMRLINVSEQELFTAIESLCGGNNQHWYQGGKFTSDEDIRRWVRRGIKNAVTIEDLLSFNSGILINVSLVNRSKNFVDCDTITSTTSFLSWVEKAKTEIATNSVTPYIRFSEEKVLNPNNYNVKKGEDYFIRYCNSSWLTFFCTKEGRGNLQTDIDFTKARQFKSYEVERIIKTITTGSFFNNIANFKLVKASEYKDPYLIRETSLGRDKFVYSVSRTKLKITGFHTSAHMYKNKSTAETAARNMAKNFPSRRFEPVRLYDLT